MSDQDSGLARTFTIVIAALVVIAIAFYFVAGSVTSDLNEDQSANKYKQDKIAQNIKPVGQVNVGSVPVAEAAPAAAAGPRSGEQVYNASCAACHGTGVAGAPKKGDAAAWAPRKAQGLDSLVTNATNGLNAMPPKGTCGDCSAEELKAAIEYMIQ